MIDKWLGKGRRILVEERLKISRYKDKNGQDRDCTEVLVDNVKFADDKKKEASDPDDPFPGGVELTVPMCPSKGTTSTNAAIAQRNARKRQSIAGTPRHISSEQATGITGLSQAKRLNRESANTAARNSCQIV